MISFELLPCEFPKNLRTAKSQHQYLKLLNGSLPQINIIVNFSSLSKKLLLYSRVLDFFIIRIIRNKSIFLVPFQHFFFIRISFIQDKLLICDLFPTLYSLLDIVIKLLFEISPFHCFAIYINNVSRLSISILLFNRFDFLVLQFLFSDE